MASVRSDELSVREYLVAERLPREPWYERPEFVVEVVVHTDELLLPDIVRRLLHGAVDLSPLGMFFGSFKRERHEIPFRRVLLESSPVAGLNLEEEHPDADRLVKREGASLHPRQELLAEPFAERVGVNRHVADDHRGDLRPRKVAPLAPSLR